MKDIKNYEGLYAITEDGRVWSYRAQRFLKPATQEQGYLFVSLKKNQKVKHCRVNRLVAEAYIPNPENLPIVNHKDENKLNNSVDNLEWCTYGYNLNYGSRNERISKSLKRPVYCIELDKTFEGLMQCAQELGISAGNLCSCLKGRIKSTKGYHFKYVEKF